MTYKAHKAKIELQCDGPKGQGCCARSSFDGRSITEALREARDAGWRLKNTELMFTCKIADYEKLKCVCPDCWEGMRRNG